MYRLLIVDDECLITDGLVSLFETEEEMIVFHAYSAKEALDILQKNRIDIVMTDINMPQMDGLALVERIQKLWDFCRIIFLTGYSSFDYAYRALQNKKVRFLLKTEGTKKVKETVAEVIEEIKKERYQEETELYNGAEEPFMFLKRNYVLDMLEEKHECSQATQEEFRAMGIRLSIDKPFYMFLLRIRQENEMETGFIKQYMEVWKAITKVLGQQACLEPVLYEAMTLLVVFQPYSSDSARKEGVYIRECMEIIQEISSNNAGVHVSAVVNERSCMFGNCREVFLELLGSEDCIQSGLAGEVLIVDVQEQEDNRDVITQAKRQIAQLDFALQQQNEELFFTSYEVINKVFFQCFDSNREEVGEIYYSVVALLFRYWNQLKASSEMKHQGPICPVEQIQMAKDWRERDYVLKELAKGIFRFQKHIRQDGVSHVIRVIQNYVDKNLQGDISLMVLSELTNLNPTYLSRVYKQETGKNLSEYICEKRVEKAKDLLLHTGKKINVIAKSVGYFSSSNFIRFFRKYAGMTPQEYRDWSGR